MDSQSDVVKEHFVVIYAPKRKRDRYPENCVHIVSTPEQAVEQANLEQGYFAAKVIGPARSSEGLRLFYLVEWLL